VTFTATVRSDRTPVTTGTVQFSSDGVNIDGPATINGSGVATVTTSTLAEGTHLIRGTYSGATGFLTSNGTVSQRVDNATVVTDQTYCNPGAIAGPGSVTAFTGPATPYPSNIFVSGLSGAVTKVTAQLLGLSQDAPIDYDIMLAGPTPTTNLMLLATPVDRAA
jgi:hypothetical protein